MKPIRTVVIVAPIVFIVFFVGQLTAQVAIHKRSTLSMGSSVQNQTGQWLSALQSVGQSSVIGSFQSNDFILAQGFIQPGLDNVKMKLAKANELQADIYPNPVTTILSVEFAEELASSMEVEVCNVLGKVIYQNDYALSQKIAIDVSALSNGIYFIQIKAGRKQMTAKLIKE